LPRPARRMQLRYLNEFRDEITWLDEPRPDPAVQAAEKRARRERLEQNTQEIRKQAEAVHREQEEARAAPPAALDPSASVQRQQLLALKEERLAREEAANLAAIEALARQEEEDARGRTAAEEEERLQLEEMAKAEAAARDFAAAAAAAEHDEAAAVERSLAAARRLQEEEDASLRLARALEMEGFTCGSCQDLLPLGDEFRLATCRCDGEGRYCIECMRGWVQSAIGSQAAAPPCHDSCPI
jgi:hypothetical protein